MNEGCLMIDCNLDVEGISSAQLFIAEDCFVQV